MRLTNKGVVRFGAAGGRTGAKEKMRSDIDTCAVNRYIWSALKKRGQKRRRFPK
jgi:hypothetical protein